MAAHLSSAKHTEPQFHLYPGDVASIPIVRLEKSLENDIADRIEKSARLRSEADDLDNVIGARADGLIDQFLSQILASPPAFYKRVFCAHWAGEAPVETVKVI